MLHFSSSNTSFFNITIGNSSRHKIVFGTMFTVFTNLKVCRYLLTPVRSEYVADVLVASNLLHSLQVLTTSSIHHITLLSNTLLL